LGIVSAVVLIGAAAVWADEQVAAKASTDTTKACCAANSSGTVCDKGTGTMSSPDTKAMHLLAIKDGTALYCACGADCKCTMKDGATKCGCGKDIVKVSLKGKYVCGCGASCACKTIADKAGKCGCGKDLILVK